jgi:adenosine deaminase
MNLARRLVIMGLAAGLFSSASGDEAAAMRRFAAAKRSEPELIAFLKKMPKGGDLHNHVTGALYSDYILDNAVARGMSFDTTSLAFSAESGPGKVSATELLTNDRLLYAYLNKVSMRGWTPNTVDGHDHFFDTFDIIGTGLDGLTTEDLLLEVARRNLAQNVQYMELMTRCAPNETLRPVVQAKVDLADYDKALAAIEPQLQALEASVPAYMASRDRFLTSKLGLANLIGGGRGAISFRYIFSINRIQSNEQFFVWAAAAMACARADRRVVAINMVAPEDHPISRNNFGTQMRILDFLWKRLGQPNVTLHAGELTLKYSPVEPMFDRIRKSIEVGHARRIGHGVSVAWEHDLPGLMKEMKRRGVLVEICLSSNESILGVSGWSHPIHLYRRHGIPVNLNTDDEGVSRSNLTMEWVKAVRTYAFGYRDLKDMARNSLEYSFLTGPGLYLDRDYRRLRPGFEGCRRPEWKPSAAAQRILGGSEKMQVQLRLERAFAEFER